MTTVHTRMEEVPRKPSPVAGFVAFLWGGVGYVVFAIAVGMFPQVHALSWLLPLFFLVWIVTKRVARDSRFRQKRLAWEALRMRCFCICNGGHRTYSLDWGTAS